MSAGLIDVLWSHREHPLPPRGVVGRGDVALRLAERVLQTPTLWRGVVSPDSMTLFVVLGDDLPWVDGVTYLGFDPAFPALWFDTRLQPDRPIAWLARRVAAKGPVAWLHKPELLVPLQAAEVFYAAALEAWCNQ